MSEHFIERPRYTCAQGGCRYRYRPAGRHPDPAFPVGLCRQLCLDPERWLGAAGGWLLRDPGHTELEYR